MLELGLSMQFQESANVSPLYEFSFERGSMSVVVASDQNRRTSNYSHLLCLSPILVFVANITLFTHPGNSVGIHFLQ